MRYLTLKEICHILDDVTWFLKGDLANGYRQFGAHPVDWKFQVYCNGVDEHYIDLACPFGKTNSSLEFCPPVKLFAESAAVRYKQIFSRRAPVLGTHVDDIFGGFKYCKSYDEALQFREFLCKVGLSLTIVFNEERRKTPLPAKSQVILGRLFNSVTKRVKTAEKKKLKYRLRIASLLAIEVTTRKELEKMHGCLNYVAGVEPFGRPFLAHLTMAMSDTKEKTPIRLSPVARWGLRIWDLILRKNKGLGMDFLLNRIPRHTDDIFVDASTSWGIGGCCGRFYFLFP